MNSTVLGIFSTHEDADNALGELEDSGYSAKDISLIVKDDMVQGKNRGDIVADTAVSGAVAGGIIGGIAGLLIGVGAIAIPGIGAVLIGGPLAAALGATGAAATTVSGAATGLLAGGLIGALVGLGVPEEDARIYEDRVRNGAILIAVPAQEGFTEEVEAILDDNGAEHIRTVPAAYEGSKEEYRGTPTYAHVGTKGGKTKRASRKRTPRRKRETL